MTTKQILLHGLLGVITTLSAGQAAALGVNTTTQLKCFYKTSSISTNPEHDYVWGRNPGGSVLSIYKISGNWWKDNSVRNMFYTGTSQATLKSVCQSTFTLMGVSQPLMMIAAADNPLSINYTIWTKDSATQPASINKVIVFGDSVSDNQNVYNATHWEMPSPHSYFLGRFTNGKVWNEHMTDALNLPNYNWAVGGAAADDYYVVPGVVSQVQSYLEYMRSAPNYKPANTLFTMLVGGNDLVSYNRTVDSIVASEKSALESLIASGARNILMLNVPNLSRAPKYEMGFKTPAERAAVKANLLELNRRLVLLRDELQTRYGAALRIRLFDTFATVENMIVNKAAYGITDATQSCLKLDDDNTMNYTQTHAVRVDCSDADAFVFWDLLHPTTRAHQIIASEVLPFVRANFPVQ